MADNRPVDITPLCQKHQRLLVRQAGYSERDPWRALLIIANVVLFQMTSTDPKVYVRVGGDIHRFKELGCLACLHPDYFGEVVQAAQSADPLALKNLGLAYIERTKHPNG